MNNIYFKEMPKLAEGLAKRGIDFKFRTLYEGCQIIVGNWTWDAVCHEGSYGGEYGLLEIAGSICESEDVDGYLTAEKILERVDKKNKGE